MSDKAVLGGGCFWCLEAAFQEVDGVIGVRSGYSGGTTRDPSYEEVCDGSTGHAEVVEVSFDPERISYREILEIFFVLHDPTTLNRQGADVGAQYRSVILYNSLEQKQIAAETIERLADSGAWSDPLVTELAPFEAFYAAEAYHRDYYRRNPRQGYCRVVIEPKLDKLRQTFTSRLKPAAP